MCVLGLNSLNAQQEVIIGTDAGDYSWNYDVPFEEYNMYSISQQIYTAEEMGSVIGNITQVSFKLVYCVDASVRNVDIYMINTDKTVFASGSDWVDITEDDLVYSGSVTYPGPFPGDYGLAWLDITLQTPFKYEGGNILICCYDHTGATALEAGFAQYSTNETRAIIARGSDQYDVSELNFASGSMTYNNQIKFVVAPAGEDPEIVPVAPQNLTVTPVDAYSINVTWETVTDAIGYNVYRDEELVISLEETEYLDEELQPTTDYCYTVVTVYEDGIMSDPSEQVCATTLEIETPTSEVPENLVAVPESVSAISLTWDAAENAMSYKVYKDGEFLADTEETSYLAEGLEYNTNYCFTVTSIRSDFESEKSDEACATTLGDGITENQSNIRIYPNPVKDHLFINVDGEINEISIYNLTGAIIYNSNKVDNNVINVTELVNGAYIVKVRTSDTEYFKRFIKK